MAIQQERDPEAVEQQTKLVLDRSMIGSVGLVEPLFQLMRADRAPPQIAMLLRPGGDDAEAATCARGHSPTPGAVDYRGVEPSSARLQSIAARGVRAMTAPQPWLSARHISRSTSGSSSADKEVLPEAAMSTSQSG